MDKNKNMDLKVATDYIENSEKMNNAEPKEGDTNKIPSIDEQIESLEMELEALIRFGKEKKAYLEKKITELRERKAMEDAGEMIRSYRASLCSTGISEDAVDELIVDMLRQGLGMPAKATTRAKFSRTDSIDALRNLFVDPDFGAKK